MKFPSISRVPEDALKTFLRFPFVLICAIAATLFRMFLLPEEEPAGRDVQFWWNLAATAYLGLVLSTATDVYGERLRLSTSKTWMLRGIILGCLLIYYFTLPPGWALDKFYRFILFALSFHLLVSFLPYAGIRSNEGFWQYNKILFLRFLTALLYGTVLYSGLSTAFLSLKFLFGVNLPDHFFLNLLYMVSGIFITWFFLAGVPKDFEILETQTAYPKSLKVFSEYILLPLVSVYLVILLAYGVKILVTGAWPTGWVVYLISYYSLFGILALLLIWPNRNVPGQWLNRAASGAFFMALVPLSLLLLAAILKRTGQYGFTVPRFFAVVLGFWLLSTGCYFVFSKAKNIRLIPLSLCLVMLLISFGPQGAFSISEKSQKNRLLHFLDQNKMLKDGKIVPYKGQLTGTDRAEINSILSYLVETHGYQSVTDLFSADANNLLGKNPEDTNAVANTKLFLAAMNVDYIEGRDLRSKSDEVVFRVHHEKPVDVTGYQFLIPGVTFFHVADSMHYRESYLVAGERVEFFLDTLNGKLEISRPGFSKFSFPIDSLSKALLSLSRPDTAGIEKKSMTLGSEQADWKVRIDVHRLVVKHPPAGNDRISEISFDAAILFRKDF